MVRITSDLLTLSTIWRNTVEEDVDNQVPWGEWHISLFPRGFRPCNHIYHPDCILPWLAIRNSCPVCRHELPAEDVTDVSSAPATVTATAEEEEDSAAELTIWRLPGGGFVVGRIPGGWRGGDRMMPVVYTEVDGGRLGDERLPRRVAWGSRRGGRDGFAGRGSERVRS